MSETTGRVTVAFVVSIMLLVHANHTLILGQSTSKPATRFRHAVSRSEDASRIMSILAQLSDSGMPRELLDRAEAVGVFPKSLDTPILLRK